MRGVTMEGLLVMKKTRVTGYMGVGVMSQFQVLGTWRMMTSRTGKGQSTSMN